jgi:hypothetical protein
LHGLDGRRQCCLYALFVNYDITDIINWLLLFVRFVPLLVLFLYYFCLFIRFVY